MDICINKSDSPVVAGSERLPVTHTDTGHARRPQLVVQPSLAGRVQGRRALVQEGQSRAMEQHSCKGQSLLLAR